jgi:hypothetical protein
LIDRKGVQAIREKHAPGYQTSAHSRHELLAEGARAGAALFTGHAWVPRVRAACARLERRALATEDVPPPPVPSARELWTLMLDSARDESAHLHDGIRDEQPNLAALGATELDAARGFLAPLATAARRPLAVARRTPTATAERLSDVEQNGAGELEMEPRTVGLGDGSLIADRGRCQSRHPPAPRRSE